ncbi:MAG: hypothetical protein DI535_21200 [Citrobacter freundii]|nr:MAG: hypothetical protein DI535_21200 [Citrobacter freundii]
MSTARRLISGSIASWVRIGIMMVSQVVLVPVYLTYWDVSTYGVWIAVQALVSIVSTLDQGHLSYMEFDFMKQGPKNVAGLRQSLWSGVWIAFFVGILEIVIVWAGIQLGIAAGLLDKDVNISEGLVHQGMLVLLLLTVIWVFLSNIGGLFVRVLYPFGYYARMSWWGVWAAVMTAFVPVIAVMMGADLLWAGITLALTNIAYTIPQFIDIFRLMKREGVGIQKVAPASGLKNFSRSLALSGKNLLENARQTGVRVILSPIVGAVGLVAFTTTRTAANIALQGLNTITGPLMPELMRFLNEKDQRRMESSFSLIWLVVILFLTPGVVLLQVIIVYFFREWTKGQVEFNPYLFSSLSLGVLVYALSQPSTAIIRGNNLLRPQLVVAIVSAVVVIGGIVITVPALGISGAGYSLLAGELVSLILYVYFSNRWLASNQLQWPSKLFALAVLSVLLSLAAMLAVILFPVYKWITFAVSLVATIFIARIYWKVLPAIATTAVKSYLGKIRLINKILC